MMTKKLLYLSFALLWGAFMISCDTLESDTDGDGDTDTTVSPDAGTLYLMSTPAGASVYVEGDMTNSIGVTPLLVTQNDGLRDITLTLAGYRDTTIQHTFAEDVDETTTVMLTAIPNATFQTFENKALGGKSGSTLYSGLVVLTGERVQSTDAAADMFCDDRTGWQLTAGTSRTTHFYVTSQTSIGDNTEAPEYSAGAMGWTQTIDNVNQSSMHNKVIVVHTEDDYYAKMVIDGFYDNTSFDNPNDYYIQVDYRLNETAGDTRF
jgi:hypothetical protein